MTKTWAMLALVAAGACGNSTSSSNRGADQEEPAVEEQGKDAVETTDRKLAWATHTFDELRLTIGVFADTSQLVRTAGAGFVTYTHSHDPARIVVWLGGGQTLDAWRERLSSHGEVELEPETAVQICGVPARKQTAIVPEAPSATGLVQGVDGSFGHIEQEFPATVHVAIGFTVSNQPVVMSWIIPRSDRDAHAADEQHFFASARCAPAP